MIYMINQLDDFLPLKSEGKSMAQSKQTITKTKPSTNARTTSKLVFLTGNLHI